ncbi:hypothetical protein KR018_009243, partial [Drosophila ironensis]
AVAALLLWEAAPTEAKRRKHKGSDHHHHHDDHHHDGHERSDPHKTKTKTKWSTSTDLAGSSQVSTEEHGYYVKRTYAPSEQSKKRMSPPYLAIPIAWFGCGSGDQKQCQASISAIINSASQSLNQGYLCDDDCEDLYDPICAKTAAEVAVFYNRCKLRVANCRSHGLWMDVSYPECQEQYPKETAYADKKFRASPFFRDQAMVEQQRLQEEQKKAEETQRKAEKEQKMREKAEKKKQEKDCSESSEEDQKDGKQKEDMLPLLSMLQKPLETPKVPVAVPAIVPAAPAAVPAPAKVAVPVAVPVAVSEKKPEAIALPPMPLKDTPTHKPLTITPQEVPVPKEQTAPKTSKDNERLKYTVA